MSDGEGSSGINEPSFARKRKRLTCCRWSTTGDSSITRLVPSKIPWEQRGTHISWSADGCGLCGASGCCSQCSGSRVWKEGTISKR
eukprot:1345301-Amorphochlora_amoeboformis.AAC.3